MNLEYLRLKPKSLRDAVGLYACLTRAVFARIVSPGEFITAGQYLHRPLIVSYQGVTMSVRPHSEDLGFSLSAHKPAVSAWFRPRAGAVVVDIGAHIGHFALRAGMCGARVFAVEPNPTTFAVLSENSRLNPAAGVRCLNLAIADHDGTATLYAPIDFTQTSSLLLSWHEGLTKAPSTALVYARALDSLLPELGIERVDWLLIDAEGSEGLILKGGTTTLRNTRMVIVEVDVTMNKDVVLSELNAAGLTVREEWRQDRRTEYWLASRRQNDERKVKVE